MENSLEIKKVPFMGTELMAARGSDGQIWAGVRWMCNGLGFSGARSRNERKKIQSDEALMEGGQI